MTKKEQAAMKAAIDRAELLAALRWTAQVEKDVPPPGAGGYSEGWTYNAYSMVVEIGWSTSVCHGTGRAPKSYKERIGKSASQNARWMYSTEAKAYAAMRNELEKMAAEKLLKVDRLMQAASDSVELVNNIETGEVEG